MHLAYSYLKLQANILFFDQYPINLLKLKLPLKTNSQHHDTNKRYNHYPENQPEALV